ncbi:hypothetical protein BpHYR1_025184 [Brachionus plicatilis]|uniref:Uncharacterized protein n=1 Tax=Brachionus plicatilis TaxID=10195 RepID=A0A3M7SPM8_BRAPC|nr:hypothetical protein BpHYR1_025184 [Brachionus plicatilis]
MVRCTLYSHWESIVTWSVCGCSGIILTNPNPLSLKIKISGEFLKPKCMLFSNLFKNRFCLIDKVTTQLVNSINKAPITDIPEKNRFLNFNVRDLLMRMPYTLDSGEIDSA